MPSPPAKGFIAIRHPLAPGLPGAYGDYPLPQVRYSAVAKEQQ
jgi:hypothetical protein